MHPLSVRKSRGNTQPHKRNLNFCPFSAYFSPFCPCCQVLRQSEGIGQDRGREAQHHPTKRGTQQDQPPRWVQVLPMLLANQERNKRKSLHSRSKERERERGTKERQGQAHKPTKKGTPPPYCREQAAFPLITNSRQKISKKSLGVDLKKFSEKFFGRMFRGKKNPSRYLNGRGCLTNNKS